MKKMFFSNNGFSLVEIAVVMGLLAIILPALLTGYVISLEGKPKRENRDHAIGLITEAEEALRSIRENSWSSIYTSGLYHPVISGNSWFLLGGTEIVDSYYTRQILIEDIQRDSDGNIVSSGGTYDPSTKKATVTVAWTQPNNDYLQSTFYLSRFVQNNTVTHTTQAEFSAGTNNGTEVTSDGGGSVRLLPPSETLTHTADYNTSSDYDYDSNKTEFVGGYAQLKSNIGIPLSTTNPGFETILSPWALLSYGDKPAPSLSRVTTGGNPGAHARLNFASARNKITQGYMYQSFVVSGSTFPAHLSFDKRVSAYQATPDDFRIRVYIDTTTGTPTNLVWDSGIIASTSPWSSTLNLDVSSFIASPETYYLKVGAYVDYPGANRGPYTVDFDNVQLTWNGVSSYPTDSPSVTWKSSFSPSNLVSWDSFITGEVTNGGSINYQLSNDGGTTWYYYTSGAWTVASGSQASSASTINSNISTFPLGNNSIKVKAFLTSNGSQLVRLDNVTIQYTSNSGSSSGSYVSPTIDRGSQVAYNRIIWNDTNTSNTTTRFQIASNDDNSTWNFVGPDGTSGTYFIDNKGTINLLNILARYLKYKIYFTTTNSDLPSVQDVTVNYSP